MTELFSTYGYSDLVTEEEILEQSKERIEAAKKLAKYIDQPKKYSLEETLDRLLKHFEHQECKPDREYNPESAYKTEDFIKKVLVEAIREQQMAELKTKMLFLMYKEINYCFDGHKRTVEKNFPNHTKKTIEKAIAQAYYALDVIRDERSIVEIFDIHPDKIYEISKTNDFRSYVYFEDFVRENKVNTKNLKRMIEILKNKEALSLETAYEKAKEEFQRNEKINHGDVTEIRKLKNDYKKMVKYWRHAVEERENAEYRYEYLKKENLKTAKEKDILIERINNFLTRFIKSDKSEFATIFYDELRKMETEFKKIKISIPALENIDIPIELTATSCETSCKNIFEIKTSTE